MAGAAEATPELRTVSGPSALGDSARRFWQLLWLTSVTDFKLRYVHAVLGYTWTMLRPLLFFGVIFLFLREILGFGAGIENYAPMLMINIILFQYFQETTNQGVRALPARDALVRKMQFPRLVIPLSISLTATLTLLANLLVGFALLLVFGLVPQLTWLLMAVAVVWLVVITTGIALLVSITFVRFRDIGQLWTVIARILFYGSPILYPIEVTPESVRSIVLANPLAPIFIQVRHWVIDPAAPSFGEAADSTLVALIPLVLGAAVFALGLWYFIRLAPRVAEEL
jgi:ABC-2 type transport system permease protein